jgi:pimeloyl-ACP methyl ester carboxylesterase
MACPANTFPPHVRVTCGFIRVLERRGHLEGRTITVAAAVVHTAAAHPRPDPIVFLDGGPSFGAISPFAPAVYFDHAAYAKRRDVILVDTRGTGLSRPRLGCPEVDRAEVDAFYAGPTVNSRAAPILRRALKACRNRLTAHNVHLAAYNTAQSASDLDALRRALGVRRWNLLAISADGPLGLTYMQRFGNGIRSAVIDSGMSTQMLWGLDYDRGLAKQLASIFRGCRANASCNARYPGLQHAFYRKVRRLQAHPVTITFPQFEPQPVSLPLDGVGLYADAILTIFPGDKFDPNEIPDLLERLWRETHGELIPVYHELVGNGPVENEHANASSAFGKSMSYICHDESNFTTRADLRRAARDIPPFAPRYLDGNYDLADGFTNVISPAGCDVWNVGRADPVQHRAVHSDIPTLVLAGEYDGGVPAYIVHQVTAGLTHARYYRFPASAHLQLAFYTNGSDCARAIATQFLAEPTGKPDSSCIADLPSLDFTIPPAADVGVPHTGAGRFATLVRP